MADVTLSLLGGFEAAVDGAPVPDSAWRLKKARELVKLLALAPAYRLHREQAMDRLWGDRDPAAAANNLNQAVHVARRVLGAETIESRGELLVLVADVDVDRFVDAAAYAHRARTPSAVERALALYRGELLPENRYDDWAEARRHELAELAAVLEGELTARGPERTLGLPADTSSFVGRSRELEQLASLLGRTRLLTLSGTGGAGKTRLALELARVAGRSYESGAALVELAPITDPRLVADAVAGALDLHALPAQDVVDAVIDFLSRRTVLLVVDNCEHVLNEAAGLADALLRAAPQLTIVATSREPLRVPGEVVFRVPSLDIPDPDQTATPAELLRYESVLLFVERARAAEPDFELDDEYADDVARICFRLDGLPLALELAAARLGALSAEAIAERLDDRFRLLRTGSRSAPTRQQTLTATLQWSHDLLEPEEAVLFRRLAAFAGSFGLEAVEEVCGGVDVESGGTIDLLGRLVEKSLVAVEERGSARRYRLLETVRLYARDRLAEAGEDAALGQRHARWALALAERERGSPRLDHDAANLRAALATLLDREPHDALRLCVALLPFWLRRIELGQASRRFADALAAAPERTTVGAEGLLAAAAIDFRSGTLAHGIALAERAHAIAAELEDRRTEWRALQLLGEFGVAMDAAEVAVPWLERAIELARQEGFDAREAIGVHSLGVAAWTTGDLEGADRLLAESIERFRSLEGSPDTIPSPLNVAEIRTHGPDGSPGVRHVFEDTLQPLVEISCDAAVGYALANRGSIARGQNDFEQARALLREAAEQFERTGDDAGLATVNVRDAHLLLAEGQLDDARRHLERALDLRAGLGDRRGRGLALSGLGLVETAAGDYDAAELYLAEAYDIFRRAGDRWGIASTLWRTADLALARGRLDDAEAALEEARSVLGPTQRERWIASTLVGLAEVSLLRGGGERAAELLGEARERYAARDDGPGVDAVETQLRALAKAPLSPAKDVPDTTPRAVKPKGRHR
jgi:predicted ATPase